VPEVEHLKLIQGVVGRMASNSFLIKGWTITLTAALLGLAKADSEAAFAWINVGVIAVFALLDSYYLATERSYRALYVTESAQSSGTYTLSASSVGLPGLLGALFSVTILPLHGAALCGAIVVALTA
jgi:hypothetical protein